METKEKTVINISANVNVSVEKVWKLWTSPEDITQWNNASEDWHTTKAENDLRVGGNFLSRMEAKDGSMGFDFIGTYTAVKANELIDYTMGDGRKAHITFVANGDQTKIEISFEAETENPVELQKGGWQSILDNFKKYAEKKK